MLKTTRDHHLLCVTYFLCLLLFPLDSLEFSLIVEASLPGLVENPVEVVCCHSVGVHFPFCVGVWVFAWVCLHAHLLELHGRWEPCWVIDNWLGSFMMEISALLCHIFLAVALLTLGNEAEFSSSLILSELCLEYKKSPGDYLLTFIFWSVWAKVKWPECRKQASWKLLFFRKNLRKLWFSATNKGFNWKNAVYCEKRKIQWCPQAEYLTHLSILRCFPTIWVKLWQHSLKQLAALSSRRVGGHKCSRTSTKVLSELLGCGCNGWRLVAYPFGTVLTVTGDSAAREAKFSWILATWTQANISWRRWWRTTTRELLASFRSHSSLVGSKNEVDSWFCSCSVFSHFLLTFGSFPQYLQWFDKPTKELTSCRYSDPTIR